MVNQADESQRPIANVLTEEDREALLAAEALGGEVQELIRRASLADIDLGDTPAQLEKALDQSRKIRQAFFPNG